MNALAEGIALYKKGRYTDALTELLQITSTSSETNIDLAYYIGLCYARLDRFDDALIYLEQIVTGNADIARVYQCRLILSYIYTKTDRTRLAEFELSKLIQAGYESVQVYASLGFLAYEHGETDKAVQYYQKALDMQEENATALNGLGYILADSGRELTRSLSLCKEAVEQKPDNGAYLDSLAWVYHKLGFSLEARTYIKRAAEKLPNNKLVQKHKTIIMTEHKEDWQK
ncbi:tetratricopeptide repeat protein [Treponema phagedenis]|uniref:Tetratricopeptide repeat protein n=1 Tax=Treponema phagedenis TaxID=162 RepID=A0A0B7H187_TREPH|nr:tetratricopeptide repeat protein [Treponema phagedenis]EFW36939.1 tetratricopeptide repeat protein [Treponema phagedenis F0421]QEJ95156.1 tetratricopeptide repeat protein [Treponema phagedenis]QEJ98602.1 tetratricopeptide repeat protein [Treponema phagedenis]QEK01079.1 tetratricopeptide repeat protein [Treponema phagedenis]QEK04107.1 tetratricopeptide repeat protein [Treponema phagedenis]